MLFHSAYFAYILLDFAAVQNVNEQSFETASIENNWLTDNFPDPARVHVVRDSDEAMVLSWTPASALAPALRPRLIFRIPTLGAARQGFRLRRMREFHAILGDTQKANNLRYPVRWHSGALDADWVATETRARRIMMWFFGDVFPEFATGLPRSAIVSLNGWWLVLRCCTRLFARIYLFKVAVRSKVKQAFSRSTLGTALLLKLSRLRTK